MVHPASLHWSSICAVETSAMKIWLWSWRGSTKEVRKKKEWKSMTVSASGLPVGPSLHRTRETTARRRRGKQPGNLEVGLPSIARVRSALRRHIIHAVTHCTFLLSLLEVQMEGSSTLYEIRAVPCHLATFGSCNPLIWKEHSHRKVRLKMELGTLTQE